VPHTPLGNGLGEGTLCRVLPRRIRNARRPIIHEVPPLSATGRVTLRCCRRGATAAIKGTVRSRAPGIHAPPLRLACDFPAADWLGIIATSSSSSSAPLPPIPASPSLATSTKAAIPRASKSAMPKWLPSTFSAITSKATGTTPSLQGNKHHPDAIIPHQILIASRAIIFCENSACVSHQKLRPLRGNPPSCPAGHSTGLRAGQQDRRQEGHGCSRPQAGRHPPSDVVRRQHLPLGRARKGMEILPNSAVRPLGFEIIAVYRRELSPA